MGSVQFLLEYKGYDNEIINNIQAGNIGLSLSEGTLLVLEWVKEQEFLD